MTAPTPFAPKSHPRARAARPAPGGARRPPPTPSTVYELLYRGRRYPPRAVAELAYRLALADPAARWPHPGGQPTNAQLEALDFTIAAKRPVLAAGSAQDHEQAAEQQAEGLAPARPPSKFPSPPSPPPPTLPYPLFRGRGTEQIIQH
ncbi:MAG: hypothetical protein WKG07_14580 [Hymenobacter sp.]